MNPIPPISILHVLNSCDDSSITRIVERIMLALGTDDFTWSVAGVKGLGDRTAALEKCGARIIDASPASNSGARPWQIIQRQINNGQVQIVHSHTPRTIIEVTRALRFGKSLPPPHSVVHINTKHIIATPADRRWGLIFALADFFSLYLPDCLVPVSLTMGNQISRLPGMAKRVFPIPNAIPVQEFFRPEERQAARGEFGIAENQVALGFSGRITRVKRLDLLMETFAIVHGKYPQAVLVLAGEGDQRAELEELAGRLNIAGSVIWIGFTHNIPHFLSGLDIYVQSSINEGLSLSILEAMSAGLPVVATRVASAEEIIQSGSTGYLVEPGKPEMMAKVIGDLIDNTNLQKQMGERARKSALRNHDLPVMTDAYRKLYNRLTIERIRKFTE